MVIEITITTARAIPKRERGQIISVVRYIILYIFDASYASNRFSQMTFIAQNNCKFNFVFSTVDDGLRNEIRAGYR